jgi:methyl-accepting chemotaxis protein
MTFEERIDRLTERHETLAQSVELTQHQIEENSRHIERVVTLMEHLTENVTKLSNVAGQHGHRLDQLDGGQA